ncbi:MULTISPECIES: DUF413 domain-containing protein [Gammaproteobacteria]|uniref:DUF413 domain-containing protein n=1 Tax=Gammaproteobacteria TaxID=1236 RepID=UPI000DD01BE5|nr:MULTISPECIES: DUF413 domain-containing protein [Gammaproteobacteria]RTE85699.1 DUF413 domain-containing protein [Aliidiomarina sp. B3213]TCZ90300.1 DUF413 domain-containing protein [Lysobacter sp. N42]
MATQTRELLLRKPFNDFRNYPYGFARSGDFSIRESDALLHYGCLITALLAGDVMPETQEDQALLAVAKGEKPAETDVEKAWAKYQGRINRPKVGSMYGRSKVVEDDSDYDSAGSTEDDLVVED